MRSSRRSARNWNVSRTWSSLQRIIDFIETELGDRDLFRGATLQRYRSERDFRRNLDRWVETLINAAIDIGKIVLAATPGSVPYTYGTTAIGWRAARRSAGSSLCAAGGATTRLRRAPYRDTVERN